MADSSVDAVVTSPPYNQQIETFKPSGMQKGWRWAEKISGGYFDSMNEATYQAWQLEVLRELFRLLKPTGSVFYNHKLRWRGGVLIHPLEWVAKSPFRLRQEIIWRRDGSPTMNARMFAPNDERIYWLVKGRHKWHQAYVGHLTVWDMNSVKSDEHPCAFPVQLPARCIGATTDPADVVLDPFCGSGTVGVVCAIEGRNFIGIDSDAHNCALSEAKIRRAQGVACDIPRPVRSEKVLPLFAEAVA